MKAEKYLKNIGLENVIDEEFFNNDDKKWYKVQELMEAYAELCLSHIVANEGKLPHKYCFSCKFKTMNKGIIEALKNIKHDLRLINHNRWMVWNDTTKKWEVYESKNRNKMGKLIIGTRYEGKAVYYLLNE